MAELGLALLTVPGSTVELFKLTKPAVERIKCFRHASTFLNKLKKIMYDLCDGQLHLAVQLVEPKTIILFGKWKDETQCNGETSLGVLILTAWSINRKTDGLSSRVGEDD